MPSKSIITEPHMLAAQGARLCNTAQHGTIEHDGVQEDVTGQEAAARGFRRRGAAHEHDRSKGAPRGARGCNGGPDSARQLRGTRDGGVTQTEGVGASARGKGRREGQHTDGERTQKRRWRGRNKGARERTVCIRQRGWRETQQRATRSLRHCYGARGTIRRAGCRHGRWGGQRWSGRRRGMKRQHGDGAGPCEGGGGTGEHGVGAGEGSTGTAVAQLRRTGWLRGGAKALEAPRGLHAVAKVCEVQRWRRGRFRDGRGDYRVCEAVRALVCMRRREGERSCVRDDEAVRTRAGQRQRGPGRAQSRCYLGAQRTRHASCTMAGRAGRRVGMYGSELVPLLGRWRERARHGASGREMARAGVTEMRGQKMGGARVATRQARGLRRLREDGEAALEGRQRAQDAVARALVGKDGCGRERAGHADGLAGRETVRQRQSVARLEEDGGTTRVTAALQCAAHGAASREHEVLSLGHQRASRVSLRRGAAAQRCGATPLGRGPVLQGREASQGWGRPRARERGIVAKANDTARGGMTARRRERAGDGGAMAHDGNARRRRWLRAAWARRWRWGSAGAQQGTQTAAAGIKRARRGVQDGRARKTATGDVERVWRDSTAGKSTCVASFEGGAGGALGMQMAHQRADGSARGETGQWGRRGGRARVRMRVRVRTARGGEGRHVGANSGERGQKTASGGHPYGCGGREMAAEGVKMVAAGTGERKGA
ncbi:hypothetical protein DENSPDRAFT_848985 [Dentipellis sp. KUC8613]|nr:hypothetical protein DENSPDRAFT_848985 [Dentipellis sp. KUC8613]